MRLQKGSQNGSLSSHHSAVAIALGRFVSCNETFFRASHPPFAALGFQSLHQMKVWHRHCVFFSFAPEGPSGRGHIQKDLPRFIPGFFVRSVMQGSSWPSHLGAAGFVKSFDHDSLLWMGSCTVS